VESKEHDTKKKTVIANGNKTDKDKAPQDDIFGNMLGNVAWVMQPYTEYRQMKRDDKLFRDIQQKEYQKLFRMELV
jgi:hypothetical protein